MKAAPGQGGASQGVSLPEAWRLVQRISARSPPQGGGAGATLGSSRRSRRPGNARPRRDQREEGRRSGRERGVPKGKGRSEKEGEGRRETATLSRRKKRKERRRREEEGRRGREEEGDREERKRGEGTRRVETKPEEKSDERGARQSVTEEKKGKWSHPLVVDDRTLLQQVAADTH